MVELGFERSVLSGAVVVGIDSFDAPQNVRQRSRAGVRVVVEGGGRSIAGMDAGVSAYMCIPHKVTETARIVFFSDWQRSSSRY